MKKIKYWLFIALAINTATTNASEDYSVLCIDLARSYTEMKVIEPHVTGETTVTAQLAALTKEECDKHPLMYNRDYFQMNVTAAMEHGMEMGGLDLVNGKQAMNSMYDRLKRYADQVKSKK